MKKLKQVLMICIILFTNSCSDLPYPPPVVELCASNFALDGLECRDDRISSEVYSRSYKKGDICTNGDDFKAIQIYNLDLRKKIYDLEHNIH